MIEDEVMSPLAKVFSAVVLMLHTCIIHHYRYYIPLIYTELVYIHEGGGAGRLTRSRNIMVVMVVVETVVAVVMVM